MRKDNVRFSMLRLLLSIAALCNVLLQQSAGGELQMLANRYSETFADQIATYLHGADSIPAFLSSVTLELFQRQTMMQGHHAQ